MARKNGSSKTFTSPFDNIFISKGNSAAWLETVDEDFSSYTLGTDIGQTLTTGSGPWTSFQNIDSGLSIAEFPSDSTKQCLAIEYALNEQEDKLVIEIPGFIDNTNNGYRELIFAYKMHLPATFDFGGYKWGRARGKASGATTIDLFARPGWRDNSGTWPVTNGVQNAPGLTGWGGQGINHWEDQTGERDNNILGEESSTGLTIPGTYEFVFHCRLNTIGEANGFATLYQDGAVVFDKQDFKILRDTATSQASFDDFSLNMTSSNFGNIPEAGTIHYLTDVLIRGETQNR